MPQTLEIDVEQIMEQIRGKTSTRQLEIPPHGAAIPLTETQIPADLAFLQSGYDIYHVNFVSHRKVLGRVVLFAKNVLRQLLTPILERQMAFNAATARVAQYLWEQSKGIHQQQVTILQTLQQTLDAFEQRQTAALQGLRTEMLEQVQAWRLQTEDRLGGLELMATQLQDRVTSLEQVQRDNIRMLEQVQQDSATRFEQVQQHNSRMLEQVQQDSAARIGGVLSEHQSRFAEWERALSHIKTTLLIQERRITILLEGARKRLPEP